LQLPGLAVLSAKTILRAVGAVTRCPSAQPVGG
jgi:transposase